MALMNISGLSIVSGSVSLFELSKLRERASGLTFLDPGRYARWKLNLEKKITPNRLDENSVFWQSVGIPDSYGLSILEREPEPPRATVSILRVQA